MAPVRRKKVVIGTAAGGGSGGFMTPPAGATLLADWTQASAWGIDESPTTFTAPQVQVGSGPQGDPIIRNTLVDGQKATWDPVENERNDFTPMTGGSTATDVPYGSTRTIMWHERFITLPTTTIDRWQLLGPEVHGQTLPQSVIQPEVSPTPRTRRMNWNAGRGAPTWVRYFDLYDLTTLNVWHQLMLSFKYINDNTGWLKMWVDGVIKIDVSGEPVTTENIDGYWKMANYRSADINGTATYDFSGCKLYAGG